ncbi:hypothetical protein SAMN02745664_1202 [Moraxella cuniculi DSM 21768]|uniref:Uncharacterized protein n=1 Tax=Moraxella cuniculi DSM 21768 TaxID=1122245 RepID=A0A1N7FYS6_9GAMM|nr:hypothetical protein [Moraxella cuniculi]OOS04192.1 hypothetical protein B0189_08730 [Moraxella cuniculi]SIS05425.1 hypothetical protein SAMN02745664_1202 [Moraxella cuniculi DSM 21768]
MKKFILGCWVTVIILVIAGAIQNFYQPKTKNKQEFLQLKQDVRLWLSAITQGGGKFDLVEYQKPSIVYSLSAQAKNNSFTLQNLILTNIENMGIWNRTKPPLNNPYTTYIATYCHGEYSLIVSEVVNQPMQDQILDITISWLHNQPCQDN